MKNAERKARIRELLKAEGLDTDREIRSIKAWDDFKKQVKQEFLSAKSPRLEIYRERQSFFRLWQLAPAFALVLLGMFLFFRQSATVKQENPAIVESKIPVKSFKQGDVFVSGKREIRFFSGSAMLTQTEDRIRIQTSELKANFKLRQKVDMQIEHPLVTVTITGTEFTLDTSAKRGSINLTEGRLRVDLKSSLAAKPVFLVAPIRFEFSETFHQIKKADRKEDRPLYRYELQNGEVLFAHRISSDARTHKVEILGGKVQQIATEDILRFGPVEKP
jgi:hypothetical protein